MLDVEAINEFLQADHEDQFKQKLKTKCLESDASLRKAVEDRDKLVKEAKELQGKLDAANSEILRLNGVMQGHIDLIGEVLSSSEPSED